MRQLFKSLYRWKIKVMFYFNLGFNEVSNTVGLIKDLAILLGFAVLVFKIHLTILETVVIAVASFLLFILLGVILKATGLSDYQNKINNSVNPELKKINEIADKLGINNDESTS